MTETLVMHDEPELEYEVPLTLKVDVNRAMRMTPDEASFLVAAFYRLQEQRIRFAGQERSLRSPRNPDKGPQPVEYLDEAKDRFGVQERYIGSVLRVWAKSSPLGEWSMRVLGVGPIIAAGLLAEVGNHASVSHLWSFAGLNPEQVWAKGMKRPFNARLKVLAAFKLGESFVKVSNHPGSLYGRLYRERKALETQRNEAGEFAAQAASALERKRYSKDTEAYKAYSAGRLPKAHIHARARRYAVKMFLSHYWEKKWRLANPGQTPPVPYSIQHLGHVDVIQPEVPYDD